MTDLTAAVLAAIAERREIAEAATPGPWEKTLVGVQSATIVNDDRRVAVMDCAWSTADEIDQGRRNAAFIAANDPTFALANLDAWEDVVWCAVLCRYWKLVRITARVFLTAEQLAEHGIATS